MHQSECGPSVRSFVRSFGSCGATDCACVLRRVDVIMKKSNALAPRQRRCFAFPAGVRFFGTTSSQTKGAGGRFVQSQLQSSSEDAVHHVPVHPSVHPSIHPSKYGSIYLQMHTETCNPLPGLLGRHTRVRADGQSSVQSIVLLSHASQGRQTTGSEYQSRHQYAGTGLGFALSWGFSQSGKAEGVGKT